MKFGLNVSDRDKCIAQLHANDRRMVKFCTSHAVCRLANKKAYSTDEATALREIEEMKRKDQKVAALATKVQEVETAYANAEENFDEGNFDEAQREIKSLTAKFDELIRQLENDGDLKRAQAVRKQKLLALRRLAQTEADRKKADSVKARNQLRAAKKERREQRYGWLLKLISKS